MTTEIALIQEQVRTAFVKRWKDKIIEDLSHFPQGIVYHAPADFAWASLPWIRGWIVPWLMAEKCTYVEELDEKCFEIGFEEFPIPPASLFNK